MAKEACIRWGAHWRQLANTIEPFMCGGYTAFMANYFDHLLNFGTPALSSGTDEARQFTFGVQINHSEIRPRHDVVHLRGCVLRVKWSV